jgi:hypothetical protein
MILNMGTNKNKNCVQTKIQLDKRKCGVMQQMGITGMDSWNFKDQICYAILTLYK